MKRRATTNSETRTRLLDAAASVMADEGYAAVTSRRIGAAAGLTPQLVHYYFDTMDDLFVELLRRRADAGLEYLQREMEATPTLQRLWEVWSGRRHVAVDIEFVALANHRKSIREAIAYYADRLRQVELVLTERALVASGISPEAYPPAVVLQVMGGLSQIMAIEQSLGLASGHDDTEAFIAVLLQRLDQDVTS